MNPTYGNGPKNATDSTDFTDLKGLADDAFELERHGTEDRDY